MKKLLFATILSISAHAQVVIPDGTRIRVRLDETISSATATEGQAVELSATDAVRIGGAVVIPEGARVTGTITEANTKRRMGRAGKLDFSIDRVKVSDDQWVSLRYSVTKKSGESHAVRTGVITAGVAAVFWPAAPVFLLMKGKDVTINKGVTFDVFTDVNHTLNGSTSASVPPSVEPPVKPPARNVSTATPPQPETDATAPSPSQMATLTIQADQPGADIEVDGMFVGSAPTTISLPAGVHKLVVRQGSSQWQRDIQITGSGSVNVNAILARR